MAELQTLRWLLRRNKRQLPLLVLLLLANAGSSILSVFFALGTKGVINGAISGERDIFLRACLIQFCLVVSILLLATLKRYLGPKLTDDLDKAWKQKLFHNLLQGEYAAVSKYHSGELINRLNNDIRTLNDGLVGAIPNLVAMVVRLVAAMATLFVMEPKFTAVLVVIGVAAVL